MLSHKWSIFGACATLFLMSQFYRASSAIIAPDLMRDLHLDHEALGLLGAVFFYVFAAVQFPLGPVLDRFGPRATMTLLNLLATAGAIIFAQAHSMTGGIVGRALLGLGMAANLMGPFKLFTTWFDAARFATLSGTLLSIGTLGSIAATTPLALLVSSIGWRGSFYLLACLNLALTVLLAFVVKDTPAGQRPSQGDAAISPYPTAISSLAKLFSSRHYWAIAITAFLRYGSYASIQALWAGPFLMQYLGLPPVTAGNLLFLISIGFIIGSPIGGALSDSILKSRKKTVIAGTLVPGVITMILSQWTSSVHLAALGVILFCLGFFNSFGQVIYAHIKELMPQEMSASAMTAVNFFTMLGGGVFIHALGGVMDKISARTPRLGEGYEISFIICSAAFLISAALYLTTRDTQRSSLN